jgi:hypothetical protein
MAASYPAATLFFRWTPAWLANMPSALLRGTAGISAWKFFLEMTAWILVAIFQIIVIINLIFSAANNNLPLREAARYGHHKVVQLLLRSEKVDPSTAGFEALLSAVRLLKKQDHLCMLITPSRIRHGHRFVVDALLGSGDYDFALIAQERERGREMRKSLRQAVQNFEPVFKEWRGPNLDVLQVLHLQRALT